MYNPNQTQDSRWADFARWWQVNHHRRRGHDWLCGHAKRIAFAYFFQPEAFDEIKFITRRYWNSEYKRLTHWDAWKLWRFTHPLPNARIRAIEEAALRFEEKRVKLKELKDSVNQKPTETDKKTVIIERRRPRAITRRPEA